ncbi:MAG TPA: tetratricopeptide repeat protein [Gammaproteobacteria bacterium]|nr:tetratricopeptide repeat protein [Gammaproteobacteria bacterium]
MTEYLTEQEQIELLKNWIKQYSVVILVGVLLAVIGITSWRYWQQRQVRILSHASAIYDEMLTKRAQNDPEATVIQARKLYEHYPKTVYGQIAALMLAKEAIDKKDYQAAEKQFSAVLHQSHIATLRQIARLRLARVMIAEKKSEEAIKLLKKIDDQHFNGLTNEIRGDAYFAINNIDMARQSYKQALTDLPNAETIRPLLQMKYDNLTVNQIT